MAPWPWFKTPHLSNFFIRLSRALIMFEEKIIYDTRARFALWLKEDRQFRYVCFYGVVVWSRNEVVEEGEGDIGSGTSCRNVILAEP